MIVSAPAAIALDMSAGMRMPPSAQSGMPASWQTAAQSRTAVSWGTPTPATSRVVQTEPGPTPTLMPCAPAAIRSRAPSAVATLPATISMSTVRRSSRDRGDRVLGVAVRDVQAQQVGAGLGDSARARSR